MNELTDLQICKRIGEIESLNGDFGTHLNGAHGRRYIDGSFKYYNPLTDDALLNQLIFKYEISISFNFCLISMITNKQYEMNFTDIPSLKRNCLLLIIEAHKDQS